jgi:hypothetical protein
LPACKKVNPLGTFSVVVDLRSNNVATTLANVEALGRCWKGSKYERCLIQRLALKRTKATKKVRQPMTIDDEPEDEQNETVVNTLLKKISLWRRSDNRQFANRICNE